MIPITTALDLLTRAAARDNREVTEAAAMAWAEDLNDNVTQDDGRAAISEHFRSSTDYLMPAHINTGVSKIRGKRLDQAMTTEIPPSSLDDDPRRAIAWIREYRHIIADGGTHDQADEHACHILGVPTERHITGSRSMPSIDQVAKTPPTRDEPPARPVRAETEVPDRAAFLAQIEERGLDTNAYDIDDDDEKTA